MKVFVIPQNFILKNGANVQKLGVLDVNPAQITLLADRLSSKVKNNIIMKEDKEKLCYTFYDGDVNIGHAFFADAFIEKATPGSAPEDWFIKSLKSNDAEKRYLKPYLFVDELVIEDRVRLKGEYTQRKSGKKYGTMCLQKILQWAKEHGYGSRISLIPAKTHSDIAPNKFYAKIGFEMSPRNISRFDEIEKKKKEASPAVACKLEKIDGRWVSRGQELFLTHPEILENYPLG